MNPMLYKEKQPFFCKKQIRAQLPSLSPSLGRSSSDPHSKDSFWVRQIYWPRPLIVYIMPNTYHYLRAWSSGFGV